MLINELHTAESDIIEEFIQPTWRTGCTYYIPVLLFLGFYFSHSLRVS